MGATKGHIKMGGRQKGSRNVLTNAYRARIDKMLESLEVGLEQDFQELSPRERVDTYVKLIAYVCPKPVEKKEEDEDISKQRQLIEGVLSAAGILKNKEEQ